jgi:hypothetical protein
MSGPESSAIDIDIDAPSAEEIQHARFLSNRNYTGMLTFCREDFISLLMRSEWPHLGLSMAELLLSSR